jgi:glucarate dehydratase
MGRDPWQKDSIARDYYQAGLWDHRPMTANYAYAGIDQALWDLCGKEAGQPLYRLWGGAVRDEVNYFYYLSQGEADDLVNQCQDGVEKGYHCFYLKVGIDTARETEMLAAVRKTIGKGGKIRIDANQAWTVAEAMQVLPRWHQQFNIDFVEAPVRIEPVENMLELKSRLPVPLCVNEGLWTESEAYRVIRSRCGDVLCFSGYWVGTQQRFLSLCRAAHLEGWRVCKHTHGELGLAAAAGQHAMLNIPNATDGIQQTAYMMQDDLLSEPLPIASGPNWGRISGPGLGVEVDEDKVRQYAELYQEIGQFMPYDLEPND